MDRSETDETEKAPDPPMPDSLLRAFEAREAAYADYLKAKQKASKAMTAYLDALWSDEAKRWRCERGVWLTGRAYMSGLYYGNRHNAAAQSYSEVKFVDMEDRHLSNVIRRERTHPILGPALLREAARRGWVDGVNPKEEPW